MLTSLIRFMANFVDDKKRPGEYHHTLEALPDAAGVVYAFAKSVREELRVQTKDIRQQLNPRAKMREIFAMPASPLPAMVDRSDSYEIVQNDHRILVVNAEPLSLNNVHSVRRAWLSTDDGKTFYATAAKTALKPSPHFERERWYAEHLIALANRQIAHRNIVAPLLVTHNTIFSRLITDRNNETRNLASAMPELSVLEWLRCMKEIADALRWLLARSLLALDIHPENLFLGDGNHAFLGDAGLRHELDYIDEDGVETNQNYYDILGVIEAQKFHGARDVPVKHAFGLLLKDGLVHFGIMGKDTQAARRLSALANDLIAAEEHPYSYSDNTLKTRLDPRYKSWDRVVQTLTIQGND